MENGRLRIKMAPSSGMAFARPPESPQRTRKSGHELCTWLEPVTGEARERRDGEGRGDDQIKK